MRRITCILGALVLLGLALLPSAAFAAVTGNIAGTITDQASGRPLAGVTVTVSGPALQGEQTEFSDSAGRYIITELPPGEYVVRFYFSNIKVERPGVLLNADQTLSVSAAMPTQQAKTQTYRIVEKAPTVDVGNTQVQTQITQELTRNTPTGRTYAGTLTLAPGSQNDPVGVSFNGATGPENNFLLDGLNTTNVSHGLIGTNLTNEFIKETEVITGGYNAEYGRATGGVVNVVTKSGSNEFHGGAWFYYTPFQLEPSLVARLGEAVGSRRKLNNSFDFGFDIGGPVIKDKIWFYAGFAPTFSSSQAQRILRARTADQVMDSPATKGAYAGDKDPSYDANHPCKNVPWLADSALCPGQAFKTVLLGDKFNNRYDSTTRVYNWFAKLNFQINENNSLILQYLGSPSTFDGVLGGLNGTASQRIGTQNSQTHDVVLHFISKMLDRKLQIDILAGFHYDQNETKPDAAHGGDRPLVIDNRTLPLTAFESDPALIGSAQVASGTDVRGPCTPVGLKDTDYNKNKFHGLTFNPCPTTQYRAGGLGFISNTEESRFTGSAGITYFARLAGTHAFKLGGDFEYLTFKDLRGYTGIVPGMPNSPAQAGYYQVLGDGSIERQLFATYKNQDMNANIVTYPQGFQATTHTLNESLYLRDSWNVGFVPGLTINAGVRWEGQQVKDVNGDTKINITDNWAPRLGFVYDFTHKGYSKIFASYGRFYESIPLDINDRQFSGEGLLIQLEPGPGKWCPLKMGESAATRIVDPTMCNVPTPARPDGNNFLNGGTFGSVSPVLRGQYSNEIVAGVQYDIGFDTVLGASYIHRDLGRIIEDMSPDGGINYIIANPGEKTDPDVVKSISSDIDSLQKQINSTQDPMQKANLQKQRADKVQALYLYKGVESFDPPKRDYNALNITATKRLSHNFVVLASYVYSRTTGNYPGLFQASNGQLDPNISSQYDLKELLINRYGPMPTDRPHNLKITGAYEIPIGAGGVTIGVNFNAISGRPIEVLGRHPTYGTNETFILQRGSGGRTPTVTALDLHLGYGRQFSKLLRVDVYWDTFNVLNQQEVTSVDDTYTTDRVLPIQNGAYADLAHLRNTAGNAARVNTNYGNANGYQAPLSMRFGIRLSF